MLCFCQAQFFFPPTTLVDMSSYSHQTVQQEAGAQTLDLIHFLGISKWFWPIKRLFLTLYVWTDISKGISSKIFIIQSHFGSSCCTICDHILPRAYETAVLWLKMRQNASWAASFSCSFPFSFPLPLSQPHSFLTCACLCPCVLHPGIKRNTVWTQPMPSKFLAASWLHGMEYLKLSATNKTHTCEYLLWICLRFGYICI